MSALSDNRNLNIAQGLEYINRSGGRPPVALTNRTIWPSFAQNAISAHQSEPITLTLTVPNVGPNGYATLSGTQAFNSLANIKTAPWDNGQIVFHSVSVGAFSSGQQLIVGTPELVLVDAGQRTYPGGMLLNSYSHRGLGIRATVPVFSPSGSVPGTISINAVGMLLGMAVNH